MFKETIDCIDAGTEFCPCHLAEKGECILCSQLQGSHFCDCLNWKGVCIYQELHDNGNKAKEQRKTYTCKVCEKVLYPDDVLLIKFEAPHKLVIDLARPGSFIFIRSEENVYFDVPISILESDIETNIISIMIEIRGIKTKQLLNIPHSLAERNMVPKSEFVSKVNEKLLMPVNSALVAFLVSLVWFVVHYITTKFEILPNSDISEISITMSYTLYIILYFKGLQLGRSGEIKGVWNSKINPTLAIIGSLIILFGSMGNQLFWIYAGFCLLVIISAVLFWKSKEKVISRKFAED